MYNAGPSGGGELAPRGRHLMPGTYIFCNDCGASFETAERSCPSCGWRVPVGRRRRRLPRLLRRRRVWATLLVLLLLGAGGVIWWGLRANPGQARRELRVRASRLTERGDYQAAAVLWSRILEEDPADRHARWSLAWCLMETDRGEEAEPLLTRLVEESPGMANAWSYHLG